MSTTPFGNPDGSRSDLNEVIEEFVSFDEQTFGTGLGIREDDLSVRVIVGAKGSGKTVYLRRLQATAVANASVYADAIRQDLPATVHVVKFCSCFRARDLTESWMRLWQCAILRSLCTHFLRSDFLSGSIPQKLKEELGEFSPQLIPQSRRPLSVYSQVTAIVEAHNTENQFSRYFFHPRWPDLEELVADIVGQLPPMYFFIDSVDEEYHNAPMFWLRCQLGLFYCTMRLLRDPRFGGRLHVIACIRDHTIASVLRGEHAGRYRDEPHIRTLSWNLPAATFFLQEKLQRLPAECLIESDPTLPLVVRWLGLDRIENRGRQITEPILSYLLRHTRFLPRDIVNLGNNLCSAIRNVKQRGGGTLRQQTIRECVRRSAAGFGNEQVAICVNQIISSSIPREAARKDFLEIYTGDSEYVRGFDETLKGVIKSIGKDKFSRDELRAAAAMAKEEFGPASDAFSVLWQNRVLGYRERAPDGCREVFFSEKSSEHFNLPLDKEEYVFHSCIIDSVGIRAVGDIPIGTQGDELFETS